MSSSPRACGESRAGARLVVAGLLVGSTPAFAQKLDVEYWSSQPNAFVGSAVSSGFDCDGDGIDDVAVSSSGEDGTFVDEGVVRIYSGATHALLQTFTGGSAYEFFGQAVALVGDVDGDGYGDVAIGAPGYGLNNGYVAVYSVKSGQLLWIILGATGEEMGESVAAAGDVDHDGHMDVLVGAPGGNHVDLFGWGTGALHTWSITQNGANFGAAVAGNVDVDGDGTPDVIVGSPYYDSVFPFRVDCGRVDVFSGSSYATIFTQIGDAAGDELGRSVCGLGDMNGDGKAEVLAGAPNHAQVATADGMVRKYDSSGAKLADFYGNGTYDFYGWSLARVPDVDGDGLPEYAIGTNDMGAPNLGSVDLRSGDSDALLWSFVSPLNGNDYYGNAVAGGDVNGDGTGDLVIGAPSANPSGVSLAGVADVWLDYNAKWLNYGTGYPGTSGVPRFAGLSDPGIGTTFTASVTNSRGAATTGILFVGFSRLNLVTSAGGTLLVAPLLTVPISIPAGGAQLSGSLPDDPALLGFVVDLQVLESDPGAAHRLSFTEGLELLIGVDYP